ncbi:uncharacterized protein [Dysidea avara]|uniref:uncharacterized protein n=1 Tax=Dysidea avara TaxID=196820 RepID=UPI003322F6E8
MMLRYLLLIISITTVLITFYWYYSSSLPSIQGHHYPDECQHYQCVNFSKSKSNYCKHSAVWDDYKELHKQVVTQQREGRFLKYVCNSRCGGYGNRIQGITVALMLAILSNRTLIIEMKYPFDINTLLHPNAIQWNYIPTINKGQQFILLDKGKLDMNWPRLTEAMFNLSIDLIEMETNLGFYWYFKTFNDKWTKRFYDMFGVSQNDNIFSYGCVTKYLFTYDKRVTDAIDKEMQELQLTAGKYVSAHYRSQSIAGDEYLKHPSNPIPYFDCAVSIINKSQSHSNISVVYFISDSNAADAIANVYYTGQIVTSHVSKMHIDRTDVLHLPNDSLIDGFIGVLVNIEVAAKGAVFIRSGSTMADLIESIGQFSSCAVIRGDVF